MTRSIPLSLPPGDLQPAAIPADPRTCLDRRAQLRFLLEVAVGAGICSRSQATAIFLDCFAKREQARKKVRGAKSRKDEHDFQV